MSLGKAQTRTLECGTILLDHNLAEKKHQSVQYSSEWSLSFMVIFIYVTVDLVHVMLDTRPSRFSCTTLKCWEGLGTRLMTHIPVDVQAVLHLCCGSYEGNSDFWVDMKVATWLVAQ